MATTRGLKKLWVDVKEAVCGRSPEVPNGDLMEVGDFRIDLSARTVTLRGHELHLNAAEFEVLVFLASHPKRLVTPRTMLATNWTGQTVKQTEFLRALVSLSRKLRAELPLQRYLKTEPWIFYSFDPGPSATATSSR